jgi:glycine oxidase
MPEHSSRSADVVIIGGGIIGCSIAWRLAQAGMKVTVLERSEPGTEASTAAAGMLAPIGEMVTPRAFSDLCIASRSLYPGFAAEIEEAGGCSVGHRSDGSLLAALDAAQDEELANVRSAQAAQGYTVHALTASEVHERVAGLSPQIRSGLFIPGDHWVDNERLMRALLTVCQRAGVRLERGMAVHEFHTKNSRIESVTAANGSIFSARAYVLAAGCWSGELASALGVHIPISPCRGQMMEFESPHQIPFVVRAGIHYLVPRADRHVLMGTTSEYAGFEKVVTGEGLMSILDGVTRLAPMVKDFRFVRAWAGLRPDTADHLPVLGYGETENLLFATGHFRNGILLTPITAEVISDLVLKGSSSRPLELYRPTRFRKSGDPVIKPSGDPVIG